MIFNAKLKELREERHFTQRQIASMLNIDVAMYNRFEKGERKMKRDLVIQLANYYKVPEEELLKCWLAGQVYTLLSNEDCAKDVISMVAEDTPLYNKTKRV
ncbi:MAG: helix-turn-helix transcriptional regulator [Bacteroidaceae bacterium]